MNRKSFADKIANLIRITMALWAMRKKKITAEIGIY